MRTLQELITEFNRVSRHESMGQVQASIDRLVEVKMGPDRFDAELVAQVHGDLARHEQAFRTVYGVDFYQANAAKYH